MVVVAAAAVEEEWVWLPGLSQPRPLVLRPPPPLLVLAPGHFQAVVLLVHHLPEHLPRERERERESNQYTEACDECDPPKLFTVLCNSYYLRSYHFVCTY